MAVPLLGIAGALGIGLSLGLLGSGGSILTVPVLVYLFGQDDRQAIAGSLLVVALIALAGAAPMARQRRIDWAAVAGFGLPGMASAPLGAVAGHAAPPGTQMLAFAATMLVASAMMLRPGIAARDLQAAPRRRGAGGWVALIAAGLGVGLLTGFVGVGGGFLIVPTLVALLDLQMPRAVGTSLVIIALNAATGFAAQLPQLLAGEIQLDARVIALLVVLGIAGSIVGGAVGARMPAAVLRRGFGLLLLPLAGLMAWSGWTAWGGGG
jgi:uncharacterized membrane protein YfcA